MGVSSYCNAFSTVISRWASRISQLKNLSESSRIFFSLTLGIFLSEDRACSLNLTSMVVVTDCPSSFFCMSLPTAAALSAFTPSPVVLVDPVENDTSKLLSRSWSKGWFHLRTSAIASASRVIASSLWSGQCFLTPSSMRWLTSGLESAPSTCGWSQCSSDLPNTNGLHQSQRK